MSVMQDVAVAPPGVNGKYSLDLPSDLQEENVRVGGKTYVLIEMDGVLLSQWLDFDAKVTKARFEEDGRLVNEMSHDGYHATLISLCLRDGATREPVAKEVAKRWPASTQMALYNRCLELNGLTPRSLKKAKKD